MQTFEIFHNEPDVRTLPAGQVIFTEGQPSNGLMYAVLDGEVIITRNQQTLETVGPGGVFGEMALLDQQARSGTAMARTDCRVAAITEQRFTRLVTQNPLFALGMMRLLAERVRHNLTS